MAKIYWLDDDAQYTRKIKAGVAGLQASGHDVEVFDAEENLVSRLEGQGQPDLIIQDLMRPTCRKQISGGMPRQEGHEVTESGWHLYEEVLRPYFPDLPVVICSFDADELVNMRRADDFNLRLLDKSTVDAASFSQDVAEALDGQRRILDSRLVLPESVRIELRDVNHELIQYLARNPRDLHRVSWINFERLIGELLRGLGYEVTHTPLSRDGGVDLWALRRDDLGDTLYAIDAKKYAPEKVLGPEPVRAIYGVAQMKHASVGMIVTTARFGPAALEMADQYRHQLALKDFDGVTEWIKKNSIAPYTSK